ncbi:MAG: RNA polymerase sigma factor FliA [Chromatiales bacterium]|nr:RNA polymerase sigma factor FliA [Chromatiales bacterium]
MYSAQGKFYADDLVGRHLQLVKRIAYHLLARLPASVQVDDLIQSGMLGLLDAANHYNPGQGASFETYATIRVRGAMLDDLRRLDWAPKSIHKKSRDLSEAINKVEHRTGNEASDRDVAAEMGITLDEYYTLLRETSASRMVSVEELGSSDEDILERLDSHTSTPVEELQQRQFRGQLTNAIRQLSEREQLIMSLYYERELNLKEIGQVLDVSESRVSQLLSQIHARLRARLGE